LRGQAQRRIEDRGTRLLPFLQGLAHVAVLGRAMRWLGRHGAKRAEMSENETNDRSILQTSRVSCAAAHVNF
jgi:hypothetical protein